MGSNPSTVYFHIMVDISLQQAEITGEVLTGRFSSTAVVHYSYTSGQSGGGGIDRVAAYQW